MKQCNYIQLQSAYFRIRTHNPLSFFIKWWYCTDVKGSYWLEVQGKIQQLIAEKIYGTTKYSCTLMNETGVRLIK